MDDYYALLGVHAQADAKELNHAWRRLALRWHPDRAGPGATATFQKLLAAYLVLSDPVTRATYDHQRGTPACKTSDASGPSAPAVMLRRLCGPLNILIACGIARLADDGVIELFLRTQEASDGGMVSISMRVPVRCPPCARCEMRGTVEELFSAWLAVRPGVADGTVLTPSALLSGMHPVSFRVRLRGAT
jgi:curved DNA-binding protein CbpA